MDLKFIVLSVIVSLVLGGSGEVRACRINSELLKNYARKTAEKLLDVEQFGAVYWPDEPLPTGTLSKSTGINITLVETHFDYELMGSKSNEIDQAASTHKKRSAGSLIQDVFVTCSVDRDRSYALFINLELENPFKVIDVYYESQGVKKTTTASASNIVGDSSSHQRRTGLFRIHLPHSSLLVQLNQRIRYDECLSVNYVQLSPTVNYEIECVDCDDGERALLDKIFSKRMSQMDAELDAILSEKILFGLQVLLNQQRLDLDMYLE